jgi:hypothetical protein
VGSDAVTALARLAPGKGGVPDEALLGQLVSLVRSARSQGASVDDIAAAGRLSETWVRSVLDVTDESLRDRLGRPLWLFWT